MIDSYMLPYRLVFWQGDIFYYMIIANEWYKEYWYKKMVLTHTGIFVTS